MRTFDSPVKVYFKIKFEFISKIKIKKNEFILEFTR
jgi:hypothetical protein